MKKVPEKVIAVDFDEVTADFISYFIYFHNLMYKTKMKKDEISTYFLYEAFKTDKQEMSIRFAEFQSLKLLERVEPAPGAIEGIKKLIEKGYAPHFVTARPETLKKETKLWLKKHFKDIDFPVFFTHQASGMPSLKKSEICKTIGAEILIDDYIENAIDCAQNGIRVFLVDAPWNQTDGLPENVVRVKSWEEITSKL
jgi:5'(3')-deoxyribonucleotidase